MRVHGGASESSSESLKEQRLHLLLVQVHERAARSRDAFMKPFLPRDLRVDSRDGRLRGRLASSCTWAAVASVRYLSAPSLLFLLHF